MAQEPNQPDQQPNQPDPSKVKAVLNDPDFYSLTPKGRKDLLSNFDPDFGKLPDAQFDQIIEQLAPQAYAQNLRAPKQPIKPEMTSSPTLTRMGASTVEAGKGLMEQISMPNMGVVPGPGPTWEDKWKSTKAFGEGLISPFKQLTDRPENNEFSRYLAEHPEVNKDEAAGTWRAVNFISAAFGGDPDQAWKDFEAGSYKTGLSSLLTVPIETVGTGKLIKGLTTTEESAAATGRHAVLEDENLAKIIGPTKDNLPIHGAVRDNVWVAQQVKPLLKQWLLENGYADERSWQDRIFHPDFFSDRATKSVKGWRTGGFPQRRGMKWFQRYEQVFDEKGNPTEKAVSNIRAGSRRVLEAANGSVEIADRPFRHIVKEYGNESIRDIKRPITDELLAMADDEEKVTHNSPLAATLRNLADTVFNAKNIGELNNIKIKANKKIQGVLSGTPGEQIGQTAESVYAWKITADAIRNHLYPKLSQLSGVNLGEYGARESAAIKFRDGVYQTYFTEVDPSQASMVAKGYLGQVESGSLWRTHVAKRMLRMEMEPAGEFNLYFKKGVGKLGEGGTTEQVSTLTKAQKALPPAPHDKVYRTATGEPFTVFLPSERPTRNTDPVFHISVGIPEEVLDGKAVTRPEMRYAGQQEVEVPREEPKPAVPQSTEEKAGSSGTTAGAKLDTEILNQVRTEHPDWTISQQLQEAAKRALAKTGRKSTSAVPETHSPMSGGSRYQQTLETGTTEKTIPERPAFNRSEAKKRQDAVGKSGTVIPDRIFTGRETRKETRWQFLPSSQEPTEGVTIQGPGQWITSDPRLAYEAMQRTKAWMKGEPFKGEATFGHNVTPFAALPEEMKDTVRKTVRDMEHELLQYMSYRGGKAPRSVRITPAKPGTITKTRPIKRYVGAAVAGRSGTSKIQQDEEKLNELLDRYSEPEAVNQ